MKIACLQENLTRGLSIVGKAVATRSTLPILSNVLLESDEGRLKLSATNLEMGINCWIGAKVDMEGGITIPARLLSDFVNTLPPERIDLNLNEETETLHINCDHFEAELKGLDYHEFPVVPSLKEGDPVIEVDAQALKSAIPMVTFATAPDESRPVLTGVRCVFEGDKLYLSAADGFRLSFKILPLVNFVDERVEIIVPAKALNELAKVIGEQTRPVKIFITENKNQVLFNLHDIDLVSQLIEGNYPDIEQVIPKKQDVRTVIGRPQFLKGMRVSHLFSRDSANIVKLSIRRGETIGQLALSAKSQEYGNNVSELDAMVNGRDMDIAFNSKFLIDVLSCLDSTQVSLDTTNSNSPGVIRGVGDDTFTHVIMPMHLAD